MSDWILKLTGSTVEAGSEVVGYGVETAGGIAWEYIALLAVLLTTVVILSYRWMPAEQTPARKGILVFLRLTFLALLLGILLRPVLTLEMERQIRQSLLVMLDTSTSMGIQDPRVGDDDLKRAAIAAGKREPKKGLEGDLDSGTIAEVEAMTRTNVLRQVLANEQLNLLPDLGEKFDLTGFTFGLASQVQQVGHYAKPQNEGGTNQVGQATLADFPWVQESVRAVHASTAMGDSIREVLNRKRGQPLAGILVASDGAHNMGAQPRTLIKELKESGVPLYFYGVGITSPRDIIVTEMDAPPASFLGDEVLVKVRVRSQGLAGQNGQLILTLNGNQVAEETVAFGPDGEQEVPLRIKTDEAGGFDLRASIAGRDDETNRDNNSVQRRLRVVDDKIRVLFVEQSPRWDYRYLQAVLTRDRRVEVKTLLLEGDPAITREEESPYIEKFPENKSELFEYDVVVFGDVDPKSLNGNQMENLNEFVSRFGGAFVMIAGRRHSPLSYADTPVADMLPVEFDGSGVLAEDAISDKPINVELTALGKTDPMLDLSDPDNPSENLWADLPPIYWVAPVDRKPGAEVLMVDPAEETENGKRPVIARHQYGLGQVLYVGTDNTWRWRRNVGDLYYTRFWGQVNQRMAQQRFIGADKRTQISLNSQNFLTGDRVRVYARLYKEGYVPFDEDTVRGVVTDGSGNQFEAPPLKAVAGQPGLYFGEFMAPSAGQYQFHVAPSPDTKSDFTVVEATVELSETAMNAKLMEDLAQQTGGRFYREENLHELAESISAKKVTVDSRREVELWATPLYFILIMLVVTIEWVVRKFSHLK